MSNLVVLGAGASYGSEPCKDNVPPLGNHLFDKLVSRGGVASKVSEKVKAIFRSDFESGMAAFMEENPAGAGPFQREMALYLSEFSPALDSLYHVMLDVFNPKTTTFSTLNYDLLLERAILQRGLKYHYAAGRPVNSLPIIKPHGSSNFWPDIPLGAFTGSTIVNTNPLGADVVAPIKPLLPNEAVDRCRLDGTFSPAMSMYAKGKHVRTSPDFVMEQQLLFEQACMRAENIYVIGVKIVPEDAHVWGPIANSRGKMNYFGAKWDEELFNSWRFRSKRKSAVFVEAFFEEALTWIKGKRF